MPGRAPARNSKETVGRTAPHRDHRTVQPPHYVRVRGHSHPHGPLRRACTAAARLDGKNRHTQAWPALTPRMLTGAAP